MYKTLGGKYKSELSIVYAWNFAHAPGKSQPQSVPEFDGAIAILAPCPIQQFVGCWIGRMKSGLGCVYNTLKEIYVLLCKFRFAKLYLVLSNELIHEIYYQNSPSIRRLYDKLNETAVFKKKIETLFFCIFSTYLYEPFCFYYIVAIHFIYIRKYAVQEFVYTTIRYVLYFHHPNIRTI